MTSGQPPGEDLDTSRAWLLGRPSAIWYDRVPGIAVGVGRWAGVCLDELERSLGEGFGTLFTRAIRLEGNEDLQAWAPTFVETALTLFQAEVGERVARGRLAVWIVGDLSEGPRAIATARAALAALCPRLPPGFDLDVQAVFLAPAGDCDEGASVYASLRELAAAGESGLFHRCYLVMPVQHLPEGRVGLLAADVVAEITAEFIRLHLATPLPAVLAQAPLQERYGAFGIATLEFPAKAMAAYLAARRAAVMLDEGYLQRRGSASASEAREFLETEGLLPSALFGRLSGKGTVLLPITIEPVAFDRVPRRHWPDRIASYHDFFEHEKVRVQIEAVRRTGREVADEAVAGLRKRTDRLVEESPSPERVSAYIEQFLAACREALAEAIAAKDRAQHDIPQLPPLHRALVQAIQHRPGTLAVLTRGALLAVVVAFSVRSALGALSGLLTALLPSFLAYRPVIVAISGALVILWGIMTLASAWATILKRRGEYVKSVEQLHREAVILFTRQQVIELLEQRGKRVEEELDAVRRLRANLVLVARRLAQTEPAPLPAWRRSLVEAVSPALDFPCAPRDSEPPEEMARFLQEHGRLWRPWCRTGEEGLAALERAAVAFTGKGFRSVEQLSTREILMRPVYDSQRVALLRELRDRAGVSIAFDSSGRAPTPPAAFLLADKEDAGLLAGVAGRSPVFVPAADPTRIEWCQIIGGISLDALPGVSHWRRRYENHPNPAELHRVPDWTALPHPGAEARL